jgi:hypothetical protein
MPRRHRSLPWPASRLSRERDVLHSLYLESRRTGRPISVIVEQAVCAHLDQQLEMVQPIGFATSPPAA